jgi:hypothetical protein
VVLVNVCDLDEICDRTHISRTQIYPTRAHRYDRQSAASVAPGLPKDQPDPRAHRREMEHARRHAVAGRAAPLQRYQTQHGRHLTADVDAHAARSRTRRHGDPDDLPHSPPQVEYKLTELGHSMSEPVLAFGRWVQEHLAEVDAARDRFDQRAKSEKRLEAAE